MARTSRKHIIEENYSHDYEKIQYDAGGYVRFSRNNTEKRGDSIQVQCDIIENFVASNPDIRLKDMYIDNKKSGMDFDRPAFQKMLSDIEAGKINCILVKDVTRFGRNAIDTGYYLERYLPMRNVRFIAITDSHDSNESDGGVLLPLKNIISESYALDIGRKRKAVHQQNIADGRFVGQIAPYGYMKDPDDYYKIVIDEEPASIVRRIFEWAADKVSGNEIARRLSSEGVTTPYQYYQDKGYCICNNMGSNYWKGSTVRDILKNRMYIGDMIQGRTHQVNNQTKRLDSSEWTYIENTHEPIISKEEFAFVQEIRNAATQRAIDIMKTSTPYAPNIFKGKITCVTCGHPMALKKQNKDGTYWYRCESQVKYGKDSCTLVSVKLHDLKTKILEVLNKQSEVILGKDLNCNFDTTSKENDEAELNIINKGLDKDGRILKSLYENMVAGLITQLEFTQMKKDYEAKIKALSLQADNIRNRQYKKKARALELSEVSNAVTAIISNDNWTQEIIDKLISKVNVYPDKSFDLHFRFNNEVNGFNEVTYE